MVECKICTQEYNFSENIPHVGSCGHTICRFCVERINGDCPVCRKKEAFKEIVINYEVLEMNAAKTVPECSSTLPMHRTSSNSPRSLSPIRPAIGGNSGNLNYFLHQEFVSSQFDRFHQILAENEAGFQLERDEWNRIKRETGARMDHLTWKNIRIKVHCSTLLDTVAQKDSEIKILEEQVRSLSNSLNTERQNARASTGTPPERKETEAKNKKKKSTFKSMLRKIGITSKTSKKDLSYVDPLFQEDSQLLAGNSQTELNSSQLSLNTAFVIN